MCSAVDFPVSPIVPLASAADPTMIANCGRSLGERLAHFDRATSSLRTYQTSLLPTTDGCSTEYCQTWPRSGTMRGGIVYQLPSAERPTIVTGSGLWRGWPTPTVDDANNVTRNSGQHQSLARSVRLWGTPHATDGKGGSTTRMDADDQRGELRHQVGPWAHGAMPLPSSVVTARADSSRAMPPSMGLNPRFGLWLMGFPVAWLDSPPLGTRSSRRGVSRGRSDSSLTERPADDNAPA